MKCKVGLLTDNFKLGFQIYFKLTISAGQDVVRAIENTCPSENGMGFAVNPTGPIMGGTGYTKLYPEENAFVALLNLKASAQWIVSLVLIESGTQRRSVCEDDKVSKQGGGKLQTLILFALKLLTFLWG